MDLMILFLEISDSLDASEARVGELEIALGVETAAREKSEVLGALIHALPSTLNPYTHPDTHGALSSVSTLTSFRLDFLLCFSLPRLLLSSQTPNPGFKPRPARTTDKDTHNRSHRQLLRKCAYLLSRLVPTRLRHRYCTRP
jgi:hypothetical protein